MINKEQLLKIVNEIVAAPFENPRDVAGYFFDTMAKRRPFLFKILTQHNDDIKLNTELFYLEPKADPKDFIDNSKAQIKAQYGSCIISYQEIKL